MNVIVSSEPEGAVILHKGYDSISPAPGSLAKWHCEICGSQASIRRDVYGPTSWAESMAQRGQLHDSFKCPNVSKVWHDKAYKLLREIEATESQRLTRLIAADLSHLLRQHSEEISN